MGGGASLYSQSVAGVDGQAGDGGRGLVVLTVRSLS